MYIPIILAIILNLLRYFWIHTIVTGGSYCYNVYHIIQPITTIILNTQYILINLFFIVIAINHFQNIVHTRCAVIVNIIVIMIECVILAIEFFVPELCVILCVIFLNFFILVVMFVIFLDPV